MSVILVSGANPVWQKTLVFDLFRPYKINRAETVSAFASGKGINFCRALRSYTSPVEAKLIQFSGGGTGRRVERQLEKEKISCASIPTAAETRICNTILSAADSTMTELIEPSGPVTAGEAEAYFQAFSGNLALADAAAICGTMPGSITHRLYERIAEACATAGKLLLIDTTLDPIKLLALSPARTILKINADELAAAAPGDSVASSLKQLRDRFPHAIFAITDGPGNAYLLAGRTLYTYTLPRLEKIASPLGSGDSASAVLESEFLSGAAPEVAFRRALAAASANCLSCVCADFTLENVNAIDAQITIIQKEI